MMDILADEYDIEESFIRVNSIDTGPLRTQMRKTNYPGEDMESLALPESIVGPYLYLMGSDAGKTTAQKIKLDQVSADFKWPGESLK